MTEPNPFYCQHERAVDHGFHYHCPDCGYAVYRRDYPNGWMTEMHPVWVVGDRHDDRYRCGKRKDHA